MKGNPLLKLMLVEDNPGDVRLIKEMLLSHMEMDFQLEIASRVSTVVETLPGLEIDLVLLDLGLPDSQGMETLRRIVADAPALPVIVLTGREDEELGVLAVQEGAQDYMVKGKINGILLARSIRYAMERMQLMAKIKACVGELQVKERLLQGIIDKSSDGIVIVEPKGIVCFANRVAENLLGSNTGELLGRNIDFPISEKVTEADFIANNKGPLVVETRAMEIEYLEKKCHLVFLHDITERNRLKKALKLAEKRLRLFIENTRDIIFRYQLLPSFRFIYVNPEVNRVTGYGPEDFFSNPNLAAELVCPQDRPLFDALMNGEIPLGTPLVIRWNGRDGNQVLMEQLNIQLDGNGDNLPSIEGIIREVLTGTNIGV